MIPPHIEIPTAEEQRLRWTLSFAGGYLKLGMIREAARELENLDTPNLCRSDVIDLRIQVMLARGHWRLAQKLARAAIRMFPGMLEFYRHAAIASEARGDLAEAKRVWCSAPSLFHQSGYFHYKIANYEAQLGNADRAQEHIALALRLDPAIAEDLGTIDLQAEPPVQ
jgi:tetratricopeptide (TPR) repeat protein